MPNFCVKCGSPLAGGPFCTKCGADARSAVPPSPEPDSAATPARPAAGANPPAQAGAQAVAQNATSKQGMTMLAKVGIAALGVILLGGAAGAVGVYYVAHRVSQQAHQAANRVLGTNADTRADRPNSRDSSSNGNSADDRSGNSLGDVCRFLSKEDVSKAVGVEIVRTESKDNGCSYLAKGTQQDMTAKHLKAMVADKGADKQTQEFAEKFAGGMMNAFQGEKSASGQNTSGEVPVFVFSLDQHGAEEQMRLNAKVFGNLGNEQGLPGIGDQAFVSADGMILVRKGKTLVRITYLVCPCGLEQVKPLAKEIADAL